MRWYFGRCRERRDVVLGPEEPMRLAALRIAARDSDRAHDFSAGRLGLRLTSDGRADRCCVFGLDGEDLVVEAVPVDAPARERALVGRFAGISFAVDDITAIHAQLAATGVHFSGPPERQLWGGILATLVDSDGDGLQLVPYPSPGPAP
jgi:catechol 2,3-dioxygenase-like lactoylglutathione lyase family enzyme